VTGAGQVAFGFADPGHVLSGVRLEVHLVWPGAGEPFTAVAGGWRLVLPQPPVQRLEYALRLSHADGGEETVTDPANPLRAPGAFGDKSVVLLDGYAPPDWVAVPTRPGGWLELRVPAPALGAPVGLAVWSPPGTSAGTALPLLVAHDGPEYDRLAGLCAYAGAMVATGALPPFRLALLGPGDRDAWYSANPSYAGVLVRAVLPAVRRRVAVSGRPVGMGASLGALAMLHAQWRHPGSFAGLFLQSGSFFDPALDASESRWGRFSTVVRFAEEVRGAASAADPVPVTLVAGTGEENLYNNRRTADALRRLGYRVGWGEFPDGHNFTAWRDSLSPHLTALLAGLWAGAT